MFNELTVQEIAQKAIEVIDKKNEPGYGQITTLGFFEPRGRICLYRKIDNALYLRLTYDGGDYINSGRLFEYYNGWKSSPNCLLVISKFLDEIKQL